MAAERTALERRVLLLAPTSRDGEATRALLASTSIDCTVCGTLENLCNEYRAGAAAVIVPEEVVLSDSSELLVECLRAQPVWSDLPIVVLSRSGAESPAVEKAMATLGNVNLIERPMRVSTLLSVVRAAIRARERQYQVRDALDDKRRDAEKLARDAMLLSQVQDSVIVTDLNGIVTFWNEGATRLFGFEASEMMGRPYADRLPEPTRTEVAGWIARIAAGEAEFSGEWLDVRKDGSPVWIEASTRRVTDTEGRPMHIMGVSRDISERKRNVAALQASEDRHRAVLSALDEGVLLHDASGTVIMANAGAERMLGLTLDQLRGRDSFDPRWRSVAEDGSELPGERHPAQVAVRTGRTVKNFVMGVHRPDDTLVWISVNAVPLLDQSTGRVTGSVASFFDVTERKRIELERTELLEREQAARVEAERASRMKDEFLATLSHELRTPLNAILGWSQILASGSKDADDLSEGLRTIERNARAQTQIIEDLLDMSRIISGKVRLDVQRLDLASVVHGAIETIKPAAEAKGIRLQAVLDPSAGPVSGDPSRLQQVLWNLLTNAVKFTPKGGRIQVLLERINSHLEVSVIDTGEGIKPEFLPHVFDRFRQADASTTRRHGGLGLGLAIVKQLVELHGGSVRVKSPGAGLGTTFSLSFPLTVIHPDPEPEPQRRHPVAASTSEVPPIPCASLTGVKVLVVDDEPDARTLVRRLLEDCEAIVITAASAEEALDLFQADPPDVLVSDVGMPVEDGYSLIQRVRALGPEEGGDVPAMALSAYARSEDRMRSVVAGYQMHLAKPVEPAELVTMVASLAARKPK